MSVSVLRTSRLWVTTTGGVPVPETEKRRLGSQGSKTVVVDDGDDGLTEEALFAATVLSNTHVDGPFVEANYDFGTRTWRPSRGPGLHMRERRDWNESQVCPKGGLCVSNFRSGGCTVTVLQKPSTTQGLRPRGTYPKHGVFPRVVERTGG